MTLPVETCRNIFILSQLFAKLRTWKAAIVLVSRATSYLPIEEAKQIIIINKN